MTLTAYWADRVLFFMNNITFLLTSFLIQLHCFTCVFLITDHFSENMTPSVTYCIVVRGRPSLNHRQHSQLLVKSEVFENVVSEIRVAICRTLPGVEIITPAVVHD